MRAVVDDQQELCASLRACPLVGSNEVGYVVVLQQRQPVDGAFIQEVLPVGCSEHLHSHRPLIQRATVHCAISATPYQLEEKNYFCNSRPLALTSKNMKKTEWIK